MGIHIIAEFRGVDPRKLSRVEDLRPILDRVVASSGLHVVSSSFHQFEPHGVSAIYLLSESHLSVHTWPEYGYMALDIFTCGDDGPALKAFALLVEEFKPKSVEKRIIRRDVFGEGGSQNTV
ncbi:MAG: adenosylmethionine decarboxylase [Candidatus Bathyarchaeia archaeon]